MLDVSESPALFSLGGPCPPTVGVAFRNKRPQNKIAHESFAELPRDMAIVLDERTLLGNSHLPGSHADNNSFHLAYPAVRLYRTGVGAESPFFSKEPKFGG